MGGIDSVDISAIMALYDVRAVGRTAVSREIARKLKITARTALRKIQTIEKLKSEGIYLSVEYSMSLLGLKIVVVLTENEDFMPHLMKTSNYFMRSVFPLVPYGIGAVFFIPHEEELHLPNLEGKHLVIELTERMRNRTDGKVWHLLSNRPKNSTLREKLQDLEI